VDAADLHLRLSEPADAERLFAIWRAAVDATHDFLTPHDRSALEDPVRTYVASAALWVAEEEDGHPLAFMGLTGGHMDALFVDPAARGRGIGRRLVAHAAALHPVLTTDVNEQNGQAVGFYARLGFVAIGRSERDGEGRPYPLLHLRLDGIPEPSAALT
jgi:putative acetyltransferase